MAYPPLSMRWRNGRWGLMGLSGQGGLLGLSVAPPSFVVVFMCHDDDQKMKGFLSRHDFWGFVPHLMRSGNIVHIVVTWHILTSGVNTPLMCLLGLIFDFLCLVFKHPFFFLSSLLSLSFAIAALCFFFSELFL